jgi:uncharacterized membrane protein
MSSIQNFILFITVLFSGLVAGLLYSYSCSVNPGLKALPDNQYLAAMQSINAAIQNPLFFISFMGILILFPFALRHVYITQPTASFYFFIAAAALYYIAVFGVTVAGNVPLNNRLAGFPISSATAADMASMRMMFEKPWNNYHSVRTTAAILSFGCIIMAIFKFKN